MQNKENISKEIIDRKPPILIPVNDKRVFLQTVDIPLTSEIREYQIRLNPNYKYCNGVMILNSVVNDEIFGIKEKGHFVLDKVHIEQYLPGFFSGFKQRFVELNMIASGTYKNVYLDKNGGSMTNLQLMFFLSNIPNKKFIKRKLGYDKINLVAGVNIGRLNFNNNFKYIKNVFFIRSGSSTPIISLRDENVTFINKLPFAAIYSILRADIKDRFIPVFFTSNNIEYEITMPAGTDTLYVIYEYED